MGGLDGLLGNQYRLEWLLTCHNYCTIEGNMNRIKIGDQVWMTCNLDVDTFRNGDDIPHVTDEDEWQDYGKEGKPAWCYYDNGKANGEKYGKLYNWHAVNDPRGLAPEGWHVPTRFEWWLLDDNFGINKVGLSDVLGGRRSVDCGFEGLGSLGYWWGADEDGPGLAEGLIVDFRGIAVLPDSGFHVGAGMSVRCLRD
jgi:hypothetical protein